MFALGATAVTYAQDPPKPEAEVAPQKEIYDTKASAKRQTDQALRAASRDNQRVLLMFGGNWCGWCQKLHDLFTNDRDIAKLIKNEYQLVLVDIGRFDKHMDVATEYGADLKKNGVPYLVVLDAEGKVLTRQETGALEAGRRHDPARVKQFLEQWKATRGRRRAGAGPRVRAGDGGAQAHLAPPDVRRGACGATGSVIFWPKT